MGQSQPLFVYFCLFYMTQIKYKLVKVLMVCLGLKPGVAGWKVKTNPLSYGGTLLLINCLFKIIDSAFAKSKYDKIDVIIRTTIESYISCCSFFPQKIAHFSHSFHLSV